MEQRLPGDGVAEDPHPLVLRAGAAGERPAVGGGGEGVAAVAGGGRGQRLHRPRGPPPGELLVLLLLRADHLAGVALDPATHHRELKLNH